MDFGRWIPVHHLATGGMAELFLALDRRAPGGTQFPYVVKQLSPHLASRPKFANMFADEARLGTLLQHRNLVRTVAVGTKDDVPFYTMEYVSGYDIVRISRELRRQGRRMPLDVAVSIVVQVCRALAYAHALCDRKGNFLNVVHRDVSPGNVMVGIDGVVKLLDFGIAKRERRLEQTDVGAVKGKVRYMSPEQASAAAIDHRSDIFSASILLWELTVWRRLFTQRTAFEAVQAIVGEDVPAPSSLCRNYPVALSEIVNKGLQKRPDDRFQRADEMACALERFAADVGLDISSDAAARFVNELFVDQDTLITQLQAAGTSGADCGAGRPHAQTRQQEVARQLSPFQVEDGPPDDLAALSSPSKLALPMIYVVVAALGLALAHVLWAPTPSQGRGLWASSAIDVDPTSAPPPAFAGTGALLEVQAVADTVGTPEPAPGRDEDQQDDTRVIERAGPAPTAGAAGGVQGAASMICSARLVSTPARARVRWNGALLGTTPLEIEVPCGEAKVTLSRAGYEARTVSSLASPEETAHVEVALKAHTYSRLRLDSRPRGARFRINGQAVGAGPLVHRLRVGRSYRISATRPGYAVWEATIRARKSDRQVTAELAPFGLMAAGDR